MRKLKVWIVGTRGVPGLQGGVERWVEKIYPKIAKNGVEITVVNRSTYFNNTHLKCWEGINLKYLWAPRNKYLEAAFHTFISVIFARIMSPNILHIQAIGPALFTPLAKMMGFKVVVTHHGPDYLRAKWKGLAKLILKLGECFALKFADKVIVVSGHIKNYLEKIYGRIDKVVVIPNGVEIPEILPAGNVLKKFNLQPKKYILCVSRFVPEKGLDILIEAYKRISDFDYKLVLVGDADIESDYSRKIKEMAREAGVVLTGVLCGKDLHEIYSNAKLFVLPSYYEGLPITLLEALSFRLPVLVSNIPPHREIPLPEYRYFQVGDVNNLREKLIELSKKDITEEEKNFIIEYLKQNHSWDIAAKKVFELYKQVIRQKMNLKSEKNS